jgi:hypothetical protein
MSSRILHGLEDFGGREGSGPAPLRRVMLPKKRPEPFHGFRVAGWLACLAASLALASFFWGFGAWQAARVDTSTSPGYGEDACSGEITPWWMVRSR